MARHRRRGRRRRRIASIAVASAVIVGVASTLGTTSLASWTDREFDTAAMTALSCAPGAASIDTRSWGRVASGAVSGTSLDGTAALRGITVTDLAPASSSSATGPASVTNLGSDAWSSALDLSVLNGLSLGAGVTYPSAASTGVYTQYGRDSANGISIGASGAVTSAAGGLVSLETPGSATPRTADLSLAGVMAGVLPGSGLPNATAQLANLDVQVGALGALVQLDGCGAAWGLPLTTTLTRSYLLNALRMSFTSQSVTDLASGLSASLGTLQTNLRAVQPLTKALTTSATSTITSALNSAVTRTLQGIPLTLGTVNSIQVGIVPDLAPVQALLAGTVGDGVVSLNLANGAVTVDLAALLGGLNNLPPNTSLLTSSTMSAITTRLTSVLSTFVTSVLQPAILTAIDNAAVTVRIDAMLGVTVSLLGVPTPVANALQLTSTISGTVAGFTTGAPAPTAATAVVVAPGILPAVSAILSPLTTGIASGLVSPLLTNVVPAVANSVVTPAKAVMTGMTVPAGISALSGVVSFFLGTFGTVLTTLRTLVALTANAQPDQPGSVGAPDTPATGRWFQTALAAGVVNAGGSSALNLYLGNASAGPDARR